MRKTKHYLNFLFVYFKSHKLLTVLFAYSIDFKDVIQKLEPYQIVQSINETVNVFDQCSERFDVFKVETKADSSYMVVAGIQDRSVPPQRRASTTVGYLKWLGPQQLTFFFFPFFVLMNRVDQQF